MPKPIDHSNDDLDLDFRHLFFLAKRFLWLLILLPVVFGLAAWFYAKRLPDIYESRASMLVESQERQYVDVDDDQANVLEGREYLNTVVETLRSRSLKEKVATTPAIAENPKFRDLQENQIVGWLSQHLSVANRSDTRLIDITVESIDPELARDVAMATYNAFIQLTIAQRNETAQLANQFLIDEESRARTKLEASERKLQEYKEANDTAALSDRQNIVLAQLQEINTAATEAKNDRLRLETDLKTLQELESSNPEEILKVASVTALPQVVAAKSQLAEAKAEFEVLKQRYLHKHPKYIAAQSKITELTRSLNEVANQARGILNQQMESARQREERLNSSLKDQERKALALDRIGIPYNVLVREVESDRAIYESVVASLKESGISQNTSLPFRLVDPPLVPSSPTKPNRMRILLVGLVLGFMLAVGLIAARELLDQTYRDVDSLERDLKTTVLAAVFQVPSKVLTRHHNIIVAGENETEFAEPFRTLRAGLSLLGDEANRKMILITSAIPGEGKSFTSLNLAASFAQQGYNTILIDADLRRPSIHRYLELTDDSGHAVPGLAECLSGHDDLDSLIQYPGQPNLAILTSGRRTPTPAELLASERMNDLLEVLQQTYDRIVIDSPPVNAVSDSLTLAARAHACCMVVRAGKSPKKAVQRAAALLRKSGGKLTGIVLNYLKKESGTASYHYYYGKEYAEAAKSSKA